MNAETAEPLPAAQSGKEPHPSFFRALQGVWLLTWRTQLTWRRLLGASIGLLAIPVLIYLVTPSRRVWDEGHRPTMGNATGFVNNLARRLTRTGQPLDKEQRRELLRICNEEFRKTDVTWSSGQDNSDERQLEEIEACYQRIHARAQTFLNDRQLREFDTQGRRQLDQRSSAPPEQRWNRTTPFYHVLIDLYFFIILPLNCVRMCGALIRDDLEANTLNFLTTRPLSRARLLVVKYLSQLTWLQIWCLVQTLLVFGAGFLRNIPGLGSLLLSLLGAQVLAVCAWSGLGVLLGQISKRYMAVALVYGTIVEMGIGRIPTNINTLSLMRHLKALLAHDATLNSVFHWPVTGYGWPLAALVFAPLLFLAVSALLFTLLEYHGAAEMQK